MVELHEGYVERVKKIFLLIDPDENRLDVDNKGMDYHDYHLRDLELCRLEAHDTVWLINRESVLSNEDKYLQTRCRHGDFEPRCSGQLKNRMAITDLKNPSPGGTPPPDEGGAAQKPDITRTSCNIESENHWHHRSCAQ